MSSIQNPTSYALKKLEADVSETSTLYWHSSIGKFELTNVGTYQTFEILKLHVGRTSVIQAVRVVYLSMIYLFF